LEARETLGIKDEIILKDRFQPREILRFAIFLTILVKMQLESLKFL